jgi:hypothetical protein
MKCLVDVELNGIWQNDYEYDVGEGESDRSLVGLSAGNLS